MDTRSRDEEQERQPPLMQPQDQAAETYGPVVVLDLPAEGHERHGAMKKDQQKKGQHPYPIDVMLPPGGIFHVTGFYI